MANNEVLLIKPVDGLGAEGDQVKVRAGYARNFLLPQGMAVPLTQSNRKQIESLKKSRALREAKELDGAQALAKQISKTAVAIAVKTGEGGKLFGAVTANDLHDKLAAAGITIEKRRIHLGQPVKTLGKHEVKIRLHPEVTVDFAFEVVSENPIEPAQS
ncbi:MAG TPA: 50S ribosomal protein L9 [Candidatus Didemnitutus sp.]|nr:50S ribosomal protein L9 [Candidatus Didemnitutus sp.]